MQDELKAIQRRVGTTFVHVTHDQEEAMAIADRIVVMNGGKIADQGPPRDVYLRPKSLFSAAFMGEINQIPVTDGQSSLGPLLPGTGTLLIRPECIGLTGGLPLGPCRVTDAAFFGTHVRAHVAPLSAPDTRLTVDLPQATTIAVGEVLSLAATDHVMLTP
nr:TOBE domain-containing protein [Tabrizicola sp.]